MKGALFLVGAGVLLSLLVFRSEKPRQMLAAMEAQVPVYSWDAGTARAKLQGDVLVVDGRQGARGARPKDAFRIPLGGRTKSILPPDDRDVRAVLVVAEANRAAEARDLAQRLAREWALEEVATLKGGYEAWIKAGLPVQ